MKTQHFVLIGNYPPDGQESMQRFAELLAHGFKNQGATVEIVRPQPILAGKISGVHKGVLKWIQYIDKWMLFPFKLRGMVRSRQRKFGSAVHFHVCDHSNAPYLACLPKTHAAITCHDVLAIRSALGYPDGYCAVSLTGIILQKWILKHLRAAERVACVSDLTLRHLKEVAHVDSSNKLWAVIHNSLNANFKPIEKPAAIKLLEKAGASIPAPFLLHIGSNLSRKNRRMLLQMLSHKNPPWEGYICYAGQTMDAALAAEARKIGISDRIYSVSKPDHETLCALYSMAHALVFPSFSEGFGWPIIEAQACGTPVIASNADPLPEVSGGAALHADPHAVQSFADALNRLNNPELRSSLIQRGYDNAALFGVGPMIEKYLALHSSLPNLQPV